MTMLQFFRKMDGSSWWEPSSRRRPEKRMGLAMVMTSVLIGTMMQINGVHCWWPGPHMVIAEIAYRQLHPDTKEHVDLYINAFKGFYSDQSDFLTAAAWADFLPVVGIYAFSDWHFIDQPILDSDLPNTTIAPEPAQENIVWALEHCYKTLQFNGAGDIWGRALMLRFLIHLVGDIHQPLHCVNRYSKSNIQKGGDGRGKDVTLKNSQIVTVNDLHNFWDAGGGLMDDKETPDTAKSAAGLSVINMGHIRDFAGHLMESHPESNFLPFKRDFTQWALDGKENAIQYVYKGISGTEIDVEANDYIDHVKDLSKRLIALAGYRLAYLLNTLFVAPPDTEKYVIPGAIEIIKNCTNPGVGGGSSSGSSDAIDSRTVSFVAAGLGFAVVIGIAGVAVFRSDKKPKHKYKTLEMAGRENRYTLRNPRPAYQDEEEPEEDSS